MQLSLTPAESDRFCRSLERSNGLLACHYPAHTFFRQPVHSVYGGAQLFKAGFVRKLGDAALATLRTYASDAGEFSAALGLELTAEQASAVYERVLHKLLLEPIEDHRVDFEDGYGNRPDAEEDGHALSAAGEMAKGLAQGILSPFIGIRIKSFSDECKARSIRTLDLFLTHFIALSGGKLPENFMITLPKVTGPEQVATCVDLLEVMEVRLGLPAQSLGLDLMIETPQVIINHRGESAVPALIAAARGRCRSVAFGTYDYTAACDITSTHQSHTHAAADFARHVMQVSLAGTGVALSDGATTAMPIGPHRAPAGGTLSAPQLDENRAVVHRAWKLHYDNVMHSLRHGYYQGWDLNPAQFPARYAAVYVYFLSGLPDASARLNAFLGKAAQATLHGSHFDDAATGQGLLNFFLRGLACGALTESEVLATGITLDELRSRSFVQIVKARAV